MAAVARSGPRSADGLQDTHDRSARPTASARRREGARRARPARASRPARQSCRAAPVSSRDARPAPAQRSGLELYSRRRPSRLQPERRTSPRRAAGREPWTAARPRRRAGCRIRRRRRCAARRFEQCRRPSRRRLEPGACADRVCDASLHPGQTRAQRRPRARQAVAGAKVNVAPADAAHARPRRAGRPRCRRARLSRRRASRGSRPWRRRCASARPKKPRCASPTFVHTRTSGSAIATSVLISPP